MASSDDEDIDDAMWASWSRQLSPIQKNSQQSGKAYCEHAATGSTASTTASAKLYQLAVELRNRLRFSQHKSRQLQHELKEAKAAAAHERAQGLERLAALQREATRLADSEEESSRLHSETGALRLQLEQAREQLADACHTIGRLQTSRDDMLAELADVHAAADDSAIRARHHAKKHMEVMDQLLSAKTRVGQLAQMEGLYVSARDELARLDAENVELKVMLNDGVAELGRSRSPTKASLLKTVQAGAAALGLDTCARPKGTVLRSMSPGRRGGGVASPHRVTGGQWDAILPACPIHPQSPDVARDGEDAEEAGEMAFLGPPLSTYPADPDHFLYGRTGGGYVATARDASPSKYAAAKPSGWVPKDVVRLVQAFRHTYSIELEWRLWEPLLLMVDEVYRQQAAGRVGRLKASQRERMKAMRRSLAAGMSYPSALQANKVNTLKKQLATMRATLAREEHKENGVLRAMAEKGFHVGHSLDRAVEENLALRRSLQQLDEMCSQEVSSRASAMTSSYSPRAAHHAHCHHHDHPQAPGGAHNASAATSAVALDSGRGGSSEAEGPGAYSYSVDAGGSAVLHRHHNPGHPGGGYSNDYDDMLYGRTATSSMATPQPRPLSAHAADCGNHGEGDILGREINSFAASDGTAMPQRPLSILQHGSGGQKLMFDTCGGGQTPTIHYDDRDDFSTPRSRGMGHREAP